MKVPILFIIFNRPETEDVVFNRIREYQPDKLYVAADGPRDNKPGEKERCEAARAIIQQVDWPCEVKTLFRDHNLGCGLGVSSAISWFFQNEEYGCILEDDVLPSISFFALCEEALPKYKDSEKVMLISSFNPSSHLSRSSQLGFGRYAYIWGWASWKRAWDLYDLEMKGPEIPIFKWMKHYGILHGCYQNYCLKKLIHSHRTSGVWHTWDNQLNFMLLKHDGLALTPFVNLTKNVGIGVGEGTHYAANASDPYQNLMIGELISPYTFPTSFSPNRQLARWTWKDIVQGRIFGIRTRLRRIFNNR